MYLSVTLSVLEQVVLASVIKIGTHQTSWSVACLKFIVKVGSWSCRSFHVWNWPFVKIRAFFKACCFLPDTLFSLSLDTSLVFRLCLPSHYRVNLWRIACFLNGIGRQSIEKLTNFDQISKAVSRKAAISC